MLHRYHLITNIDDINSIVKFCSKAQIPLINNNNPAINNKACVNRSVFMIHFASYSLNVLNLRVRFLNQGI